MSGEITNISFKSVSRALGMKKIHVLVTYYRLRHLYRNAKFYSYKQRWPEIAESLQISERTLRNHIRDLIAWGYAYDDRGTLFLTGVGKLKKLHSDSNKKCQINISKDDTKETVKAKLLNKLLERYSRQVHFINAIKSNRPGTICKSGDTAAGAIDDFLGSGVGLGQRRITKIMQVSQKTSKKMQILMNELGLLHSVKQKACLIMDKVGSDKLSHLTDFENHRFVHERRMYESLPTVHYFPEKPIQPVTYRQIKRYFTTSRNSGRCKK